MTQIEPVYRLVGAKIQHIRETLGKLQATVAKEVHLTRASLANIEGGKQRLQLHMVENISRALGVSPKHLMRGIWD